MESSGFTLASRGLISLADEAYEKIRRAIQIGAVGSQRVLREAELARDLQMSRTPVREALLRLRAEGLLSAVRKGGYVLVEIDERALKNAYAVRGALEALAARLAAESLTRTHAATLEDLFEAMEAAMASQDAGALEVLNGQFHDAIAAASGNDYLQATLANVRDVVARYRATALADLSRRESAHADHGRLLDAILRKDASEAARLAEAHAQTALHVRLRHSENRLG
jgi:DNA-binding GntR family transcriptional regulator